MSIGDNLKVVTHVVPYDHVEHDVVKALEIARSCAHTRTQPAWVQTTGGRSQKISMLSSRTEMLRNLSADTSNELPCTDARTT